MCPHCDRVIYNRRLKTCEFCGTALPAHLVYSDAEVAALLKKEKAEAQARYAAQLAKEKAERQAQRDQSWSVQGGIDIPPFDLLS
jgi:hypothetical protein